MVNSLFEDKFYNITYIIPCHPCRGSLLRIRNNKISTIREMECTIIGRGEMWNFLPARRSANKHGARRAWRGGRGGGGEDGAEKKGEGEKRRVDREAEGPRRLLQ